ncbi:MAG: VWA domain-containing protein [Solirubrobacteraceae bacterium]
MTPTPVPFDAQMVAFAQDLRAEGMALGTSEMIDATQALSHVGWMDEQAFREALATTIAKSPEDRRIFDLVFDRFFFRATELQALALEVTEPQTRLADGEQLDLDDLRRQIAEALENATEAELADLARLAVAAFARGEGSGVLGVDVQRIRRALGLRIEPQPDLPEDDPRREGIDREQLRRFEQALRHELERSQINLDRSLPPKRPLSDLDRSLPAGPVQDLAAVQKVVSQLRRRLATQGHENRGHVRHAQVDVRATMRASLQTGGVPIQLRYRPKRPRRPELFVLCDVSTSVTSASTFFLSVLHSLHDAFRKQRSFVFIERISEITELLQRERDFKAAAAAIAKQAGVADVSGYTDYGRVWSEFLAKIEDDLHPRATVIILGDARTNGRPPGEQIFAAITARAGRTYWLNPEPRLYWNYGDSVISVYERYCEAFECWRTDQLEQFVQVLSRPKAR